MPSLCFLQAVGTHPTSAVMWAFIPPLWHSVLSHPLGSLPLWSVSLFHLIRRPLSKFRFYLSSLHKISVPFWCKIYFTLTSLTSVELMLLSSTCSSVMLIEAHWVAESYPKICSFFFRLTVCGYTGRPDDISLQPITAFVCPSVSYFKLSILSLL